MNVLIGGRQNKMLVLENLRKSFDGHLVLDHIDLKVAGGEIVSILGRPGSGKTTLLSILAGYQDYSHGTLLYRGKDYRELDILSLRK